MTLNETWEQYLKDNGAEFVCFVDASALPGDAAHEYACAVLFGKALSKEYLNDLRAGRKPKRNEMISTERKMDALADKLAERLEAEGYTSVSRMKTVRLPYKTVALRAGLGFIGKNNLLVNEQFGCALILGKVLTTAPFESGSKELKSPQCGQCSACVDACPTQALHGKTWSVTTPREEILDRKRCTLCLMCMVRCPYTENYAEQAK